MGEQGRGRGGRRREAKCIPPGSVTKDWSAGINICGVYAGIKIELDGR